MSKVILMSIQPKWLVKILNVDMKKVLSKAPQSWQYVWGNM